MQLSRGRLLLLVVPSLVACSPEHPEHRPWGLGVRTFDAAALGCGATTTPEPWLANITTASRLSVPTYDGSRQVVHPDVLLERDPDGATRMIMAITPYPYSKNRFENPSIVTSRDGMTFEPLGDGLAPLVPPPPIDHNDDPDLRRDPATGDYELLYLETMRPKRQTLVALRSPI